MQTVGLLCCVLGSVCNTTRLYGDAWHSGNSKIITNPELKLTAKPIPVERNINRETNIKRASDHKSSPNCYYVVTDICVKEGSPVVIQQHKEKDGYFRVCNDLRKKVKIRFASLTPRDLTNYHIVKVDKPLYIAACWQQYGYHLWLCIMSMYYTHVINNMGRGDVYVWNHAASMERTTASHYSMADYFGSPTSWYDPRHPNAVVNNYKDSHFWPLWAAIATDPGSVYKLFRPSSNTISSKGPMTCYPKGIIGMASPLSIPIESKRMFSTRITQIHTPELLPLRRTCTADRLLLIALRKQGGGLRTITNPEVIVEAASSLHINTRSISFEDVPFVEQLKAAATTDIFISSHGGGNTWLAILPPHSVFIECWLDYPRRLVYHQLASDLNIRYYTTSQGVDGAAFLSKSVVVAKDQIENVLQNSLSYLNTTRCCVHTE